MIIEINFNVISTNLYTILSLTYLSQPLLKFDKKLANLTNTLILHTLTN